MDLSHTNCISESGFRKYSAELCFVLSLFYVIQYTVHSDIVCQMAMSYIYNAKQQSTPLITHTGRDLTGSTIGSV